MKLIESLPGYFINQDFRVIGPYKKPIYESNDKDGYKKVRVRLNGSFVTRRVHRLICEAFHGPPSKETPWALHNNGNNQDNRPENLRWGSPKQNTHDSLRHFKQAGVDYAYWNQGNRHKLSKLSPEKVRMIRETCSGQPPRGTKVETARKLGVSPSLITRIIQQNGWKHVK